MNHHQTRSLSNYTSICWMHHHHRRCYVLSSSSPYHHGLLKLHHLCTNLLFIHTYYCKQKRTFFSPNSSNGSSKGGPQRIFSIRQSLAAIDKKMLLKHTIIFIIGTVCMDIDRSMKQTCLYYTRGSITLPSLSYSLSSSLSSITLILPLLLSMAITSCRPGAVLGYLFEQLMVKDMLLSLYYYISSLILRIVDSIYSLIR